MYLAKHYTVQSLSDIGQQFGGKDHTTVMYAIKRIDNLAAYDAEFKKEVDHLVNILQA